MLQYLMVHNILNIHLSYLPLSHIYERCVVWGVLFIGGKIGFYIIKKGVGLVVAVRGRNEKKN